MADISIGQSKRNFILLVIASVPAFAGTAPARTGYQSAAGLGNNHSLLYYFFLAQ
ncbi:hypothetical protein RABR111495_09370 [Rahnella bruchi]|uniref:hypothetical protein n=1 Tax=Rahnella bruchi TaxID=1510573 RepID=UPI0013C4AD85|nr:hypothetical protein [Rahnella bruchi]